MGTFPQRQRPNSFCFVCVRTLSWPSNPLMWVPTIDMIDVVDVDAAAAPLARLDGCPSAWLTTFSFVSSDDRGHLVGPDATVAPQAS
jgi:hypothetical protein